VKFSLFSYDPLNLNTANHISSQLHELYLNFSFLCRLTHFRQRLLHSVRSSFHSTRHKWKYRWRNCLIDSKQRSLNHTISQHMRKKLPASWPADSTAQSQWCSGGQRCSMWSYSSVRREYSHRHCDVRAWNNIQLYMVNFGGKIVYGHRKDEVRCVII